MALPPCAQGREDRLKGLTQGGKRVVHPRRYLGVDRSLDQPVFFHLP